MLGKRQFSLGYMLLEISWIGIALGLICASLGPIKPEAQAAFVIAGMLAGSAAIGGLFGQMALGVYCTLAGFGMTALVASIVWSLAN